MRRFSGALGIALLLPALVLGPVAASDVVDPPPFTWTLSASATDPYVNTGVPTFNVASLYLWVVPGSGSGWAKACLGFEESGMAVFGVVPRQPHIALPDQCFGNPLCTPTLALVADLIVLDVPGRICIVGQDGTGIGCTWDCGNPPVAWENSVIGYANDGAPPCAFETWAPCSPVGVKGDTWGRTKALYR